MNEGLVEMFEYNRWATNTLIEACRGLDDAVLDRPQPVISGTVREVLLHMVGGQQTFVLRTKGRQHEGELNRRAAWPGWDELQRLADETSAQLIEVARGLQGNETADLTWMGQTHRHLVRFFLVHAMEHSAEHRTEIKVALAYEGVATPDLDGWAYAAARGYGEEV
jgi:uncharacterized damage-inducible protein DinB